MDAKKFAGEIIRLLEKDTRTATEEKRLSELHTMFGDHNESALAFVRAAMKGDADALRTLHSFHDKEN